MENTPPGQRFRIPDLRTSLPYAGVTALFLILTVLAIPACRQDLLDSLTFTLDSLHPASDRRHVFDKAVRYTEQGRINLAIRTFERILKPFNPTDPYQRESLYNIGVLHYQLGQTALQRMNTDPRRKRKHQRAMHRRFEHAKAAFASYLSTYAEPADRRRSLAEALAFIDGLDEHPASKEAKTWKDLGQQAYYLRDYDTALNHYLKAIALDPSYDTVYNNIGSIHYFRADYSNAVRYWIRAVELDPVENRDLFLTIGAVYYQHLKDPVQAVRYFKEHLRHNPRDPQRRQVRKLIRDLETGAAPQP